MATHEDDWGTALEELYNTDLKDNTEDELWVNQKSTYIETPVDIEEESVEDSEWGKELARVYREEL